MDQLITIDKRKEKITDKLSTEYSMNRISMDEYERLIKYSQNIETENELQILEKIAAEYGMKENSTNENITIPDNNQKKHFTILSSKKTTGEITSGKYINILSTHKIIINEEDLVNDKTVLDCMSVLGDIILHIPENVNLINKATPILADVSIDSKVKTGGGGKSVIITGKVILGDIRVKIKTKIT